jgi:hypothetical protein
VYSPLGDRAGIALSLNNIGCPRSSPVESERRINCNVDWSTGKVEAKRQAEIALLAESDTAHPYHWAPFVLIGDCGERTVTSDQLVTSNDTY